MDIPRIPEKIKIINREGECLITIDGKEFPYAVGARDVIVNAASEIPSVTLTLLAEEVEVRHALTE